MSFLIGCASLALPCFMLDHLGTEHAVCVAGRYGCLFDHEWVYSCGCVSASEARWLACAGLMLDWGKGRPSDLDSSVWPPVCFCAWGTADFK